MGIKIYILICLLLASQGAIAYTLDEIITVDGGGELSASTAIPNAGDLARGIGKQTYHRQISVSNDTDSVLVSSYSLQASSIMKGQNPPSLLQRLGLEKKYNLTPPIRESYNKYFIVMNNDARKLVQEISANWLESFKSNNSITNSKTKLATNLDIQGRGFLSEAILDWSGKRMIAVASASVKGDFDVMSNLSDAITRKTDLEILRDKLESVNISGEFENKEIRNQFAQDYLGDISVQPVSNIHKQKGG